MEKVWVIQDMHDRMQGIYTSLDDANIAYEAINGGHITYEILEIETGAGLVQIKAGLKRYRVLMDKEGSLLRLELVDIELDHLDNQFSTGQRHGKNLCATVWAIDFANAVAIVQERRMAMIASGEWPETKNELG